MAKANIAQAIAVGAPAYNAGNVELCADIYEATANDLLEERAAELLPSVAALLRETTEACAMVKGLRSKEEADQIAWAFRRAFDAQAQASAGVQASTESSSNVKSVIAAAIAEGAPTYNRGDAAGCERIYAQTAQDLLAGRGGELRAPARKLLQGALQSCLRLPDPKSRAWELRRALDALADEPTPKCVMRGEVLDESASGVCLLADFAGGQGMGMSGVPVNDTVMGGRSDSELLQTAEGLVFQGAVTKQGGGGFVSCRLQPSDSGRFRQLLRQSRGLIVTVRRLRGAAGWKVQLNEGFNETQWQADFIAPATRGEVQIAFSSLVPTWRGMPQGRTGLSREQLERIQGIGFMLSFLSANGASNAGFQEGPFALCVQSIKVY